MVSKRQGSRDNVAHLAAKLMAEDGITDFAQAKRKAARQLGLSETQGLPRNTEIESALRQYQTIFQQEEQQERVEWLRREAVRFMRRLERFNPHLTGSVLTGTACRYTAIDIFLFTDSDKEVELFLMANGFQYTRRDKRLQFGESVRLVPGFWIDGGAASLEVAVLACNDVRMLPRNKVDGKAVRCATVDEVAAMLGMEGA